jgi:hypothetical protein
MTGGTCLLKGIIPSLLENGAVKYLSGLVERLGRGPRNPMNSNMMWKEAMKCHLSMVLDRCFYDFDHLLRLIN